MPQFNIMMPSFHTISFTSSYLILVIKVVLFPKSAWLYSPWIQPIIITSVAFMRTQSFLITSIICIYIVPYLRGTTSWFWNIYRQQLLIIRIKTFPLIFFGVQKLPVINLFLTGVIHQSCHIRVLTA